MQEVRHLREHPKTFSGFSIQRLARVVVITIDQPPTIIIIIVFSLSACPVHLCPPHPPHHHCTVGWVVPHTMHLITMVTELITIIMIISTAMMLTTMSAIMMTAMTSPPGQWRPEILERLRLPWQTSGSPGPENGRDRPINGSAF